jgi:hypothetical protein
MTFNVRKLIPSSDLLVLLRLSSAQQRDGHVYRVSEIVGPRGLPGAGTSCNCLVFSSPGGVGSCLSSWECVPAGHLLFPFPRPGMEAPSPGLWAGCRRPDGLPGEMSVCATHRAGRGK